MKIKDLIEKLQTFPQELEVDAEGCDCINEVIGCEEYNDYQSENRLLLNVK